MLSMNIRRAALGAATSFCLAALAMNAAVAAPTDSGTAAEAKNLLEITAKDIQADKAGTLSRINAGEAKYKIKDLYPICGNSEDGTFSADPSHMGTASRVRASFHPGFGGRAMKMKDMKDSAGKAFGVQMFERAQEGKFETVTYMWPRPDSDDKTPVMKVAYVTKIGDQVCSVAYHR